MSGNNVFELKRRKLIQTLGTAAVVAPFFSLIGCGGNSSNSTINDNNDDNDESNSGVDTGNDNVSDSSDWASGGTASLQETFPPADPFASGLGNLCTTTRSYTLGP